MRAKKDAVDEEGIDALFGDVARVYSTSGRKVVHLDIKNGKPSREDVLALLLGRSGSLRAPVIKCGDTLIVGFHEETYARVFG